MGTTLLLATASCLLNAACMSTVHPGPQSTALMKGLQVPCWQGPVVTCESCILENCKRKSFHIAPTAVLSGVLIEMNTLGAASHLLYVNLNFNSFCVYECFACMSVCALVACLVHTWAKKWYQNPWNWSY